jgi:hypothetical protein
MRAAAASVGNNAMTNALTDRGEGSPLDAGFREKMERSLGASLGNVRVRNDKAANASAASLDANAYTVGEEIVLGGNAPSTREKAGQDLLAHELVHVVQQRTAATVRPDVSEPNDSFEQEANSASALATIGQAVSVGSGGSVPGVQRQPAGSTTKPAEDRAASRDEVMQAVLVYLQRAAAAQGGYLRMNKSIRTALRGLAESVAPGKEPKDDPGRTQRSFKMEQLLESGNQGPADLAERVAQVLPQPFDRSALDRLQKLPVAEDEKSTLGRVKDLAEKSFPKSDDPDKSQQPFADKHFDEEADKIRAARGSPQGHGVGPVSVDVLGAVRFLRGLPGTVKPKKTAPVSAPRGSAEIDKAVQSIPDNALVPADARGTDKAGNFAEARELAASLARDLDVAQQQQKESVELHLPDDYNHVKDREAMVTEVVKIVQAIRQALPHHASSVKYVDVFFGNHLVTRNVASSSQ